MKNTDAEYQKYLISTNYVSPQCTAQDLRDYLMSRQKDVCITTEQTFDSAIRRAIANAITKLNLSVSFGYEELKPFIDKCGSVDLFKIVRRTVLDDYKERGFTIYSSGSIAFTLSWEP